MSSWYNGPSFGHYGDDAAMNMQMTKPTSGGTTSTSGKKKVTGEQVESAVTSILSFLDKFKPSPGSLPAPGDPSPPPPPKADWSKVAFVGGVSLFGIAALAWALRRK